MAPDGSSRPPPCPDPVEWALLSPGRKKSKALVPKGALPLIKQPATHSPSFVFFVPLVVQVY
jgi:hypothetical protein